ncbi:hypothetical protein K1719_041672 [Acacia pycnantha]|nr:hypothetical protein K1719_041672 [Acacia pycnantha]
MEVIDYYGADALRLYLINSPVVRAETLRFKKEGVYGVVRDVFLPWYNAYRFLVQNAKRLEIEGLAPFVPIDQSTLQNSSNVLDQWINSATQSLVHFVRQEMDGYRLYTVVPYLLKFLDNLTNIYVRFNCKTLKGRTGEDDCRTALSTLYNVLLLACKVMAPFTPFFTEVLYQNMRKACNGSEESIHYCSFPQEEGKRGERIEQSVSRMMTIIDLTRNIRERHNKPLKTPLREMVIVHPDADFLEDIAGKLREYVLEELNVRSLVPCNDTLKYSSFRAEPDFSILGKRLGKSMGVVAKEIKAMSQENILAFENSGEVIIANHCLKQTDIKVLRDFKRPDGMTEKEIDAAGDGDVLVILDLRPDESLFEAGAAREIVNRIQKLRKKSSLEPADMVEVYFESLDEDKSVSQRVLHSQESYIRDAIGSPLLLCSSMPSHAVVLGEEKFYGISGMSFGITLARPALMFNSEAIVSLFAGEAKFGHNLQTYLLSRDHSNLKNEFQEGNGKGAGKSAALNSLIGHPVLPTGENGATRAPISIDLQRDGSLSSKSIILQIDNKSQQVSASALRRSLQDRLSKDYSGKGRDEIYLKLCTSTAPPLKLVDLPGLDQHIMNELIVSEYLEHNDAILLVVVPVVQASKIASSRALRTAKEYDAEGTCKNPIFCTRTIGVISKIDQAASDKKSLAAVQALLLNQGPARALDIPWVALIGQSVTIATAQTGSNGSENSLETAWRAESESLRSILTGAPQSKLGRIALVDTLAQQIWSRMKLRLPNLLSGIKQLPIDRHFDISNVKKIVLEADGYQPYLISPEKGLRSLIKGVLELAKEPSRLCVDELLDSLNGFAIWSFVLALLDAYAWMRKKVLHNAVLVSLFVVGDWIHEAEGT